MNPASSILSKLQLVRTYAALLYSAENPFGVKRENFILGTRDGVSKAAGAQAPNNYPQVRLSLTNNNRGQNAPRVFGMNRPNFDPTTVDTVLPMTCQYLLVLIHQGLEWDQQRPSEEAIDKFLETLRPNFGLKDLGVVSYVINESRRDESSSLTQGQMRTVSRRTITVVCRPYQSVLRS